MPVARLTATHPQTPPYTWGRGLPPLSPEGVQSADRPEWTSQMDHLYHLAAAGAMVVLIWLADLFRVWEPREERWRRTLPLRGRHVLITDSGTALGRELALLCASRGASLTLFGDGDELEALATACRDLHDRLNAGWRHTPTPSPDTTVDSPSPSVARRRRSQSPARRASSTLALVWRWMRGGGGGVEEDGGRLRHGKSVVYTASLGLNDALPQLESELHVVAALQRAERHAGPVEVALCGAAGQAPLGDFHTMPLDEISREVLECFWRPLVVARALVRMRRSGGPEHYPDRLRLVALTGASALVALPGFSASTAPAQSALRATWEGARLEHACDSALQTSWHLAVAATFTDAGRRPHPEGAEEGVAVDPDTVRGRPPNAPAVTSWLLDWQWPRLQWRHRRLGWHRREPWSSRDGAAAVMDGLAADRFWILEGWPLWALATQGAGVAPAPSPLLSPLFKALGARPLLLVEWAAPTLLAWAPWMQRLGPRVSHRPRRRQRQPAAVTGEGHED